MEDQDDPTPSRIYAEGVTENGGRVHFRDYPRLGDRSPGLEVTSYSLRNIRPLPLETDDPDDDTP